MHYVVGCSMLALVILHHIQGILFSMNMEKKWGTDKVAKLRVKYLEKKITIIFI